MTNGVPTTKIMTCINGGMFCLRITYKYLLIHCYKMTRTTEMEPPLVKRKNYLVATQPFPVLRSTTERENTDTQFCL